MEAREEIVNLAGHLPRRGLVEPHGIQHDPDAFREAQHLAQLLGRAAEHDLGVRGQGLIDLLA
jgi:hypothetical protein